MASKFNVLCNGHYISTQPTAKAAEDFRAARAARFPMQNYTVEEVKPVEPVRYPRELPEPQYG